MANTRDILGDQETLEALISNDPTLTEFIEDGIKDVIYSVPLSYKDKLVMIDLGEIAKVCGFNNDSKLMHLLLHNTTMVQLINAGSFANTPIKAGCGTIYVPESLLATYQANSNWSTYFFKRLEDYPNYEFGTITDSWETIANNANYATDYAIGDTKTVNFGEYGYMNMELVAFDADDKADGTGKAHMTWIAKDLITKHNFIGETNTSNWSDSYIRKWLRSDVLCQIPHNILGEIVEVNKTYYDYSSKSTKSEIDTIWLPSAKEMSDVSNAENAGVIYTDYFTDNSKRIKKLLGGATVWWLRSNNPTSVGFWAVSYQGVASSGHSDANSYGIAPGFCIGGKSESQYWTDLVAAIKEETYTRLYSVGDKLPYTVDGNTYHAVIVGIDADEDALGNKIPFSFITEELPLDYQNMNDSKTNANGWKNTKMRNTVLPAIKNQMPTYVTSNIIKSKKTSYDETSKTDVITYDELWLPSYMEMNFNGVIETTGIKYDDFFVDNNSRRKTNIGQNIDSSSVPYRLRTSIKNSTTDFALINGSGAFTQAPANSPYLYSIGFCIGLVTEESLWNELYDAIDDGTYATKYAVGDKLPYTIGDNVYHAVIAGIDVDEDENGNKVPITFVTEELYAETAVMNDTATGEGGWRDSKMRTVTMPAIEALLPEHLRNRINAVKKVSLEYGGTEQVTYDVVWIPSAYEITGSDYEGAGTKYTDLFTNDASRTKNLNGTASFYWLRTVSSLSANYFQGVDSSGNADLGGVTYSHGITLSFSVGHIPEKIQWRMLSDAIEDGTYATKYSVGDLIPYTTTDGDTYHAQIAAFDTDVDAAGNAVPVTFINKECLKNYYRMSATNTNTGGWEVTEMRTVTLPLFKSKMPNYVLNNLVIVKKISSTYENSDLNKNGQITYDDLWLPSCQEMGSNNYETQGVSYSQLFTDNQSKYKIPLGMSNSQGHWYRSCYSSTNRFCMDHDSNSPATNSYYIAPGFCYGAPASSATTVAPTSTDVSKAYGVEWDYSQTSPALTRKGLSASFTDPSPATSVSGSGSSPFDSIWPWAGMEVYNITPEGCRIKKGETGFSFTDYDVMVYIPEFWYTAQKDTANSKWTWAISPTPIAGYEKHPGSGRFVGRYHTSGSASAVASKSGVAPLASTSQTNFRTYSKNKGDNWYMLDIATWSALQMLYLVEYANFDSQTTLGKGWNTGSVGNVGGNDTATYHDIKIDGAHNMYRWIEDPFSNVMDWIDGFIGGTNAVYVGIDNVAFNGQTSALTQVGSLKLPSSNEIKNFGYDGTASWAFIPSESVANNNYNTYVCDHVASTSLAAISIGGSYYNNAHYGMFTIFNITSSNEYTGSRLIYLG